MRVEIPTFVAAEQYAADCGFLDWDSMAQAVRHHGWYPEDSFKAIAYCLDNDIPHVVTTMTDEEFEEYLEEEGAYYEIPQEVPAEQVQ